MFTKFATFFTVILLTLTTFIDALVLDPEQETKEYLLPSDNFYGNALKKIFSKSDSDLTPQTIKKLGFKILDNLGLHVLVAKHPSLPGYVFKFFKYGEFPGIDWQHWINRIEGAKLIQEGIDTFGYKKFFKVPKKWLFKTNATQMIEGVKYPCYILIAEDMQPESRKVNHKIWRSQTTSKILIALHKMIKTYGLRDSARVANVPYCKYGKIAFVDTEAYNSWPVNYHPLLEFLSSKNKNYWRALVHEGGDTLSP